MFLTFLTVPLLLSDSILPLKKLKTYKWKTVTIQPNTSHIFQQPYCGYQTLYYYLRASGRKSTKKFFQTVLSNASHFFQRPQLLSDTILPLKCMKSFMRKKNFYERFSHFYIAPLRLSDSILPLKSMKSYTIKFLRNYLTDRFTFFKSTIVVIRHYTTS